LNLITAFTALFFITGKSSTLLLFEKVPAVTIVDKAVERGAKGSAL